MNKNMPQMMMDHEEDPVESLLGKVDTTGIEVFHNQVLLAIYIRPQKTKSGLILTSQYTAEDRWQSKVGLLVAHGPTAFQDPDGVWFQGLEFKVGDWLVFRPSDGYEITISSEPCRLLVDTNIKGRVAHPDLIY